MALLLYVFFLVVSAFPILESPHCISTPLYGARPFKPDVETLITRLKCLPLAKTPLKFKRTNKVYEGVPLPKIFRYRSAEITVTISQESIVEWTSTWFDIAERANDVANSCVRPAKHPDNRGYGGTEMVDGTKIEVWVTGRTDEPPEMIQNKSIEGSVRNDNDDFVTGCGLRQFATSTINLNTANWDASYGADSAFVSR